MQGADVIVHARYVVPVVPRGAVLENHALVMRGGVIVALAPSEQVRATFTAPVVHELTQHVLTPGFVNAHTHAPMALMRSYVDNVELMDWLQNYIWPAEGKFVDATYVRDGTELAVAEMVRAGVTAFLDMYFFPATTADVVDHMGVRAGVGVPVLQSPTPWASGEEDALAKGRAQLIEKYRDHPRVKPFLAPHAPYTVTDAGFAHVVELSKQLRVPINTHLHESEFEVTSVPVRPMERLHTLGVLGPSTVVAHMCHLTADEIALAAKLGVNVVHCPSSNLKLASGLCPVKELLDAGVNVCLGTDGAGSNDDLDILSEMKASAFISKLRAKSPVALSAVTLVEMATINGAKALGWGDIIGSLEIGKQADVVAIHMRNTPVFDIFSALVYVGTNVVTDVWVGGRQLLANRTLVGVDENALIAKGDAWGAKMRAHQDAMSAVTKAKSDVRLPPK